MDWRLTSIPSISSYIAGMYRYVEMVTNASLKRYTISMGIGAHVGNRNRRTLGRWRRGRLHSTQFYAITAFGKTTLEEWLDSCSETEQQQT